ncbi:methyltransferase domain-containing protein [Bacillus sp. 165]|uniref:class I SAM-dependent methyltransferase n=1 Tax=Bacillus sp. 165 TaxID=1529117 RepID=UPI001ADD470F|nr:methyltransferase domain-containing protein [Bacillus sp. 165]MBO9129890.1 methyltransferase domain-containing protein [Bacillus sp. 165]
MDLKKQVQDQFGKHAHLYVTSENHAQGEDLSAMSAIAGANNSMTMLDIATGGGHVANRFASIVKKVVALDLTDRMLQQAEAFIKNNGHSNVEFVQGDAEALPFADNSFDIVTCRIAPHHFPNIASFVKETYRVLKKGGVFLLIDNVAPECGELDAFYNTVEKRRDLSHHRALKKTEWLNLLEISGFTIEQMISFTKTFSFNSWFDRMGMPLSDKQELENFILQAPDYIHNHFCVKEKDGRLESFQAQSVLVKVKKR